MTVNWYFGIYQTDYKLIWRKLWYVINCSLMKFVYISKYQKHVSQISEITVAIRKNGVSKSWFEVQLLIKIDSQQNKILILRYAICFNTN